MKQKKESFESTIINAWIKNGSFDNLEDFARGHRSVLDFMISNMTLMICGEKDDYIKDCFRICYQKLMEARHAFAKLEAAGELQK